MKVCIQFNRYKSARLVNRWMKGIMIVYQIHQLWVFPFRWRIVQLYPIMATSILIAK